MDLSANRLMWAENGETGADPSVPGGRTLIGRHIMVCDLGTGHLVRLATAADGTFLYAPRGTGAEGDTVVFTIVGRDPSQNSQAGWAIVTASLTTGSMRVIATADVAADPESVPATWADGQWVTWSQPVGDGKRTDVYSYNLVAHSLRRLASSVVASGVSVMDGIVYYDDQPDRTIGMSNLYAVPANGASGSHRVTSSGNVGFPFARNGWIAWVNRRDGAGPHGTVAFDEYVATPAGVVTAVGLAGYGNTYPGDGFALYLEDRGLIAHSSCLSAASPGVVLSHDGALSPAGAWPALGDLIAYATSGADFRSRVIHIASATTHGIQTRDCRGT